MAFFNTCADCGSNLDPGERCGCKDTTPKSALPHPQTLTLTFHDGNTIATKINGCQQEIVEHYTTNNYLGRKNPVVSILFHETGETVELPYTG